MLKVRIAQVAEKLQKKCSHTVWVFAASKIIYSNNYNPLIRSKGGVRATLFFLPHRHPPSCQMADQVGHEIKNKSAKQKEPGMTNKNHPTAHLRATLKRVTRLFAQQLLLYNIIVDVGIV